MRCRGVLTLGVQSFKSELRVVKRAGGLVYRVSIPHEIAEQKGVKGKYLRLGVLVKGKETTETEFTAKLLEKPFRVQVPKRIMETLGVTKFPTAIRLEFLGIATKADRVSATRPKQVPAPSGEKPSQPSKVNPKVERLPAPATRKVSVSTSEATTKVGEESVQDVTSPKVADDVSRLRSEVESIQDKLKGLNERLEEHITTTKPPEPPPPEHVTESKAPAVPPPAPPKEAPTQVAPDKQTPPPVPSVKGAIPVEFPKPPIVTPPLPADSQERLVSINDKPPKYEVVRVDDESMTPITSQPGEVKSTVTPGPKPEEAKIRFERDGNCISIYKGNEQLSTVCMQKTVRGVIYHCGICDWEAIKRGGEGSGDCEHIQMVKKFLSSLG